MSKKELELMKYVAWMAILWAQSLRDAGIPYKQDLKKAHRAYNIVKRKLYKIPLPKK